ncbi:MAG TPA: HNH endonuclease signature motif containing protein [Tepidisphaeraceae bacterium]|nr:HNH endonuclease signature motif containing protein [Tepidisphaeraceae bacterium]
MPDYKEYLSSEDWAELRAEAIERAGGECERCGSTENLQVHHRTYRRLGQERLSDLECVCDECHREIHGVDDCETDDDETDDDDE